MLLIKTKNLTKHYGIGEIDIPALRGVTFDVKRGEFVAIMGPSGSGKSTLLNLIGCLDTPTLGEYFFNDTKIDKGVNLAQIRRENIGFVFQSYNLIPQLTAIQNVEIPQIYAGVAKQERYNKSKTLLDNVGLLDRLDHKPNELSGGEKQRVAIARALSNDPELIIADEPTGNLDSKTAASVMETFTDLNRRGTTVVMVTHEDFIAEYATRTLHLKDGKLVESQVNE